MFLLFTSAADYQNLEFQILAVTYDVFYQQSYSFLFRVRFVKLCIAR